MENFSSTILSFVIILSVSASLAVAGDVNDGRIKEACGGTLFPDTCISTLSAAKSPKSTYADPVELAELEVIAASDLLSMASTAAGSQQWNDENMSEADEDCFKECKVKLHNACKVLDPYNGKINISNVRSFLVEAKSKHIQWNCDVCRRGDDKKKVDEISVGNQAEKFMAVLPQLLEHVHGK